MEITPAHLHECCVVAYRACPSGLEFCLLTPVAENRWEFPKVEIATANVCGKRQLQAAATAAGLHGTLLHQQPLGSYVASRRAELRSMVGYLMVVERVDESWPRRESHRRLWCLAEEARVRIRRKPLRRFIDLAIQSVKDPPRP